MSKPYTIQVRIKVNGNKHSVVGYSSYDSKSYDKKFKNAVLNAVYVDFSNRNKKLKYDSVVDYDLVDHSIAYVGMKPKKAKRGVNRRLHNEILLEREVEKEKHLKKNKSIKHKREDTQKSISSKQHHKELYGETKMKKKQVNKKINPNKLTKKQLVALYRKEHKNG